MLASLMSFGLSVTTEEPHAALASLTPTRFADKALDRSKSDIDSYLSVLAEFHWISERRMANVLRDHAEGTVQIIFPDY
jgi:hypothetical protein